MKTVVLKRKEDAPFYITDKLIADDIVTGLIGGNYYIPVIDTSAPGIVFHPVDQLIAYYLWPVKNKVPLARLESFLKGHNPNLAFTIQHYEDDSIIIDEVKDRG
jgi:hypothetical protein